MIDTDPATKVAMKVFAQFQIIWKKSDHFRVLSLVLMLYLCGYFRLSLWIPGLIGYAMIYSHHKQLDVLHKQLQSKYVHYDKHPQLVQNLITNVPKWIQHGEWEKCRFLNNMLEILWPQLKEATEKAIRESVGPMLYEVRPGGVSKLELDVVDLGDAPLRIEAVKVISKEDAVDEVIMDLQINLSGGDTTVSISAGNKVVSILAALKYIEFRGTLRVILWRLFDDWPLFNAIRLAFIEPPVLKYKLTAGKVPLSNIPGFEGWLTDLVHDSLSETMVWPNEMIIHLDADPENAEANKHPKGVLTVRIIEAKDLQNKDLFGKSDPMATVWLNKPKLKTRTKKSTLNPVWNEVFEFTVFDKVAENLNVSIENVNMASKNEPLGNVVIDLKDLKPRVTVHQWHKLKNIKSGKIHIELFYRPFIKKSTINVNEINLNETSSPKSADNNVFDKRAMGSDDINPPYLSPQKPKRNGNRNGSRTYSIDQKPTTPRSISRSFALAIGQSPSASDSDSLLTQSDDHSVISPLRPNGRQQARSLHDGLSTLNRPANRLSGPPDMVRSASSLKKMPKIRTSELPDGGDRKTTDKIKARFKKLVPHDKGSPNMERTFDGIIRVNVISASNLQAENRDGTSDPFVFIRMGDRRLKTCTKTKTCDPIWDEQFQIKVSAKEIQYGVLEFVVKDYDKLFKNSKLGRLSIPVKNIMAAEQLIRKEYQLEDTKTGTITLELEILSVYSASEIEVKSKFRLTDDQSYPSERIGRKYSGSIEAPSP